jgi:hypothetical protein
MILVLEHKNRKKVVLKNFKATYFVSWVRQTYFSEIKAMPIIIMGACGSVVG